MECDKYKQGFIDALEKVAQDFANKGLRSQDEMSACEIQAFLDTRHVHYEECRGAKPLQQTVERLERERDTARKRVDELEAREVDVCVLRGEIADLQAQLAAAQRPACDLCWAVAWVPVDPQVPKEVDVNCMTEGSNLYRCDCCWLKQQAAQLREENKSLMACQCDGCAETLEDNDAYCQKCWAGLQTAHTTLRNFIGVTFDAETQTWVSGKAPYFSAGTTETEACIAAVDALRLATSTLEEKYAELSMNHTTLRGLVREVMEAWVNGRKVCDGIPLSLRQRVDATLPREGGDVIDRMAHINDGCECRICKPSNADPDGGEHGDMEGC